MKTSLKYIILLFITPAFAFGQTKVSPKDIQEIVMLKETGETSKALEKIDILKKTVKIKDSLYALVIMTSAEINMEGYNCEEAIKDNQELIQLNPEKFEADCQAHIGQYKKYLGEFDGAIIAYKRAIELDSNALGIHVNFVSVYNEAGKYAEAINILKTNPNPVRSDLEFYHYAFAYYKLNKFDSAKVYIDKYIKTDFGKNDFFAYKIAGPIYYTVGDKNKSCDYITKANEIVETTKIKEQIGEKVKNQNYSFVKKLLKEIEEAKNMKVEFCK